MTGGKKIGLGSALLVAATTPANVAVGGLISCDGPNKTKAIVDVTTIDASTVYWVEKIGGYKDSGTVTLELAFYSTDDAGQNLLIAGLDCSTAYAFKLFSGSTADDVYDFKAIIQDLGAAIPGRDEMLTRSVTLAVTGNPGD